MLLVYDAARRDTVLRLMSGNGDEACTTFAHRSIEEAQRALCPEHRVVEPDLEFVRVYEELYGLYRELYFGFGKPDSPAISAGRVLPTLRRIAAAARGNG